MKKKNELIRLYYDGGGYRAELFHHGGGYDDGGYFHEQHFIGYSKKEVIKRLRNNFESIDDFINKFTSIDSIVWEKV